MLQQTQTGAVSEKFLNFIRLFPDFQSLSNAPLDAVLKAWQGLGYNRRAIALKKIAETVVKEYNGDLPRSVEVLETFPGIGKATASSIAAFAFNESTIFVETNIRRVYIYFFFPKETSVNDREILKLVEKTIDSENPRRWYYALMDYGVMLKKTHPDLNKKSSKYRKQAPFKGSDREIRGKILKFLLDKKSYLELELISTLNLDQDRVKKVILQLEKEGFIKKESNKILISK